MSQIVVQMQDFSNPAKQEADPQVIRWGFNPCQREKFVPAIETGMSVVPFARFFPITRFPAPAENHSIDWTQEKEALALVSAASAQYRIEESLAGKGAQDSPDWGFRAGFYGETDASKMEVFTQVLVPTISAIRDICDTYELANPIGDECAGSDELDFGKRELCQACWREWLKSDSLADYIEIIAREGLEVRELSPDGQINHRLVKPSPAEFGKALDLVLEAYQVGTKALQNQWKAIADELKKGTRSNTMPYEDGYRKDLHASKPEDRDRVLANEIARSVGGGNNQSQATNNEIQQAQFELLKDMRAELSQLRANQSAPPVLLPKLPEKQ